MAQHQPPPGPATTADIARQVSVAVGAVVGVIGAVVGSGALGGTPIADAAGGLLSPDATPLAPASGAFSIWTLIYVGLVAFAVWQLQPSRRTDPRQRSLGWLVAASLLLNAAWILVVQAGWIAVSVVVIALLLGVLLLAFQRCAQQPAEGWGEALVVDGTVGVYLGWVCVAICANAAAALVSAGADLGEEEAELWAVAALAVLAAVGGWIALLGEGRMAPAVALGWGLAWIAVARTSGEPESIAVAAFAVAVAAIVLLTTLTLRRRYHPRRAI
jgi:hypothetical protein